MRTTTVTILLIAAISVIVDSMMCYTCQTVTNDVILVNLTDKMFNRSSLPITADCASNISTATLTSCPDKCLIAITQSTDEEFAIRACASTVFKPAQLAALQLSAMNISSLNNSCYTSQPDSTYEMAPALATVCFCATDSCNSASWDTIMPKVVGNNDGTTLHIVTGVFTLIACFIATTYY